MALEEQQLAVAVDYARVLLDPTQQQLPDALTASLEQAIHDWDQGALQASRTEFEQVVRLARQMQYL